MGDDDGGGPFDIPPDLVSEILSYLPVKSLLRFTCVCKSWLSLIRNDHHFALKNYITRTTSSSRVLDHVDYVFDHRAGFYEPCMYSFTQARTFRSLKKFDWVPSIRMSLTNLCNGIICFDLSVPLTSETRLPSRSMFLLCNPAIQEVLLVPPCPISGGSGLGYDPINDDYKVVAISTPGMHRHPCTASVYSVRRGHWRNINDNASITCINELKRRPATNANGRKCNWLFSNINRVLGLASFDMTDEVLKEFPMPQCIDPKTHMHVLLSSTRWHACLSCLPDCGDFSRGFIDVWVLEDLTWSKKLGVKLPCHEPMRPYNIWMNDNELLVVAQKGNNTEFFYYDVSTQQLTRTGRTGSSLICPTGGYVESLISIKRLEPVSCECNQDESKQEDNGECLFREVNRNGVRWSRSIRLF